MENIKFTKYYKEPSKPYDIICVSVFRLNSPYKDTSVYSDGMTELFNFIEECDDDNLYLRVYFDDSLSETKHDSDIINKEIETVWQPLIERGKKSPKIQMVKYDDPIYKIKNTVYHVDLYGTLMRFIPIFEKDNSRIVIISDIDFTLKKYTRMLYAYNKIKTSEAKFNVYTALTYADIKRFDLDKSLPKSFVPQTWFRLLACGFISKVKLPKEVFNKFYNCIGKCKNLIRITNYISKLLVKKVEKYNSKFPFGIDEIFLNYYLFKYILDENYIFAYNFFYNFHEQIWASHIYTEYLEKNPNDKYIKQLYKLILEDDYDEEKSLLENFNKMDAVMYELHPFQKNNEELIKKTKYYISNVNKNKRKIFHLKKQAKLPKNFEKIIPRDLDDFFVKSTLYVSNKDKLREQFKSDLKRMSYK